MSLTGRVLAALLQIGILALLTRQLGVERFGVFAIATSVTLGLMTFSELGMGARVLRGRADPSAGGNLSTFSIVRVSLLALLVPVALLVSNAVEISAALVVCAAAYAAGEATGDLAVAMLQGQKRSGRAMFTLVLRRIAVLAPLLAVPGPDAPLIACGIGAAGGFIVFALTAWPILGRPRNPVILIRENLGLILGGGASSASQWDAALVGQAAGASVAGLYGSAVRLFNPINLAVSTMLHVLVPEISAQQDERARLRIFKRVRRVILALAALMALGSVFAPVVVVTLFGDEFQPAAPVAVAVFLGASLSAVAQVHMAWYYAVGLPRRVPLLMWFAVIVGLAAVWILSLNGGVVGSAVGLFLMHLFSTMAVVLPWRRTVGEGT